MKTTKKQFLIYIFVLLICFIGTGFCVVQPLPAISAEDNNQQSDALIESNFVANARIKTATLQPEKQTAIIGEQEMTFDCFQWRDLESISFHFTTNAQILSFKFLVSFVQSETLDRSFGTSTPETLFEGNSFTQFDFLYFFDSSAVDKNNTNSSSGHDFGLYKFDLIFSYTKDSKEVTNHKEFAIAVFPDNIDEIEIPLDLSIIYSISSSNRLMNVFNLYLSSDVFKYVNPARLQWEVVGVDTNNVKYCLDNKMKDKMEYGAYEVLWDSLINTSGTNFVFDSNDVEGTWTVMLSINRFNTTETILKVENLSTIKIAKKTNWWLIVLMIGLVIFVVASIFIILYFVRRKKEKVW